MTQQRANEIKDNIKYIQNGIAETAAKYNLPQKTTLMAVTKTFPAEDVAVALESGLTLFGENRIQEAYTKFQDDVFKDKTFDLHIIGHLQRNKAAHAVEVMSLCQSIDKNETLAAINDKAVKIGKQIDYLIEVNTSGEPQKSGVAPEGLDALLDEIAAAAYSNCHIRGLMTVGPLTDDAIRIGHAFENLQRMFVRLQDKYDNFDILSMGMSGDYKLAMREGSTLVRIGSALFGHRDYSKK